MRLDLISIFCIFILSVITILGVSYSQSPPINKVASIIVCFIYVLFVLIINKLVELKK